jgi:N-acyl-D-aspartate/D-glutamate deacylase
MTFDLVVRGGQVFDGTGTRSVRRDLGVSQGRIEALEDLSTASSDMVLDARGLAVAPGFIDFHTHSDFTSLLPSSEVDLALASVRQGVTTEVFGNCGFSAFPFPYDQKGTAGQYLRSLFGPVARPFADLSEFATALTAARMVNNKAPLVGHGSLRASTMHFARRAASHSELDDMASLLSTALDQGAFGLTLGLIYPPGSYSDTNELTLLARILHPRRRLLAVHLRDEMGSIDSSVEEMETVARGADISLHLSHLKVAGRQNWGRSHLLLDRIAALAAQDIDVSFDVYPYTSGSTVLHALLPPWILEGGMPSMISRLRDPVTLERVAEELSSNATSWQNLVAGVGWDRVIVASAAGNPSAEGRSIAELAVDTGQEAIQTAARLLVEEEGAVTVIVHMMREDDVQEVVASPFSMIGSDGIPVPGKPHPRWAGSFARVLGKYCREQKVLPLASCIRKMTSMPADRLGLTTRGRIAPGFYADLVVFDPSTVSDQATYEEPLAPPVGIEYVIVNGEVVVREGAETGLRPGRVLAPTVDA